jgi:hypothetical protein
MGGQVDVAIMSVASVLNLVSGKPNAVAVTSGKRCPRCRRRRPSLNPQPSVDVNVCLALRAGGRRADRRAAQRRGEQGAPGA